MIGITRVPFGDLVETVSYRGHQVDASRFLPSGQYPVVDQGENEIAGYVNDVEPIKAPLPLVVFGDHTRNVKFADRPFVVGADGVKLLRPKDQRIGARYLYWLTIFAGSRIPNLGYSRHFSSLREVVVPVLESAEARAKAAFYLDRVQHIVDTLSAVIAAKREFKRGLMQELLTGRRRFREFVTADPWVKVRLGDIVAPVQRPVAWDDHAQYRLVSIRRRNGGLFLREVVRGADIKTKKLFTVRTDDLVLSRMQVVHGAVAVVPPEFDGAHVSGMYMVLRPQQPVRVRTEFLHYLFHLPHMYQLVLRCCYGVHIEKMTFNPDRFFRSRVLIPQTIDEQDRITAVLRWLDQEIDTLVRLHAAHREQQRGLMQKLLTGELTVPVSSEPEPVHA